MTWASPFARPGRWLKGNLHTHTSQSDGLYSPDQAIAWYQAHGYDFIALTDHWVLTTGQSLGAFTTVTGAELHGATYHLLTLGLRSLPDRALADDEQAVIDHVRREGGLAIAAHPYWTGQTSADLAPLEGLLGLEVFNAVCEAMAGLGHGRVHWDNLLAAGKRLWGLAVDDVHWRHGAQGQAFVMVRAVENSEEAILTALAAGAFYASTGPVIDDLLVLALPETGPVLRVRCSPCQSITFHATGPLGHRFMAAPGERLHGAEWPLSHAQGYLRVECRDERGCIAWSNPLFVRDILGAPGD